MIGQFGIGFEGKLGRKLVCQIVLVSALLSLIASTIQLYAGYQRDRSHVLSTVTAIDKSFRSGLEEALWQYNFPLVQAILEGVYIKNDVQHVVIKTDKGRSWELGNFQSPNAIVDTLEFVHANDAGIAVPVGSMEIGLTLASANARVWSQLWTILLSNFAKTACASAIMLMLFNKYINRHLRTIATHVSRASWQDSGVFVVPNRDKNSMPDDIDLIVDAVNFAKRRAQKDFEALKYEVEQRRKAESTLKQKTLALEDANNEQAQFIYAISHDLKSPANTVRMLIDELEISERENLSDEGKEILDDAEHTIVRMLQLVEDVLGYARTVGAGIESEVVDPNLLVDEIIKELQGDISSAKAVIDVSELPEIQGSKIQLRILFQNLISNAIKFRCAERIPKVSVRPVPSEHSKMVAIAVNDNGIGIAPEFHERVFGLFQRLHSHSTYAGSGLGLTLCKRIASNHAGAIRLSSRPGEGTCFEISLPRSQYAIQN
ncbi:ATP-binding protein [uncultured Roseovarius sp.]|uniref:ATP-binding protein n=1 Tax=uncultured Roseovarius sp. TaxID=293344 RepID=UPI00260C3EC7|nr:ATP-binding protein [uncultured Roseovarius sp.]